jgi:D-alanyl-D-alanine carboxypeptidase/D-alanyl-D-alanine-endopeptidase (penicillin-binding protein 4)
MRAAVVALAFLVGVPPWAHAYVPEATRERTAEAAVARVLGHAAARGTLAGIVIARGGRTLVEVNARRPMTPASLMKLATTTTAMLRFGPDHRFTTTVLARERGPVVRDLWLVGGGDPTLATERYRRHRFEPKPTDRIKRPAFASGSPTIDQLAGRIRAAGIASVGRIIADESLFDGRRTQRGWLARYLRDDPDIGLLAALTVNEGRADLEGNINVASPPLAAARALRTQLVAGGVAVGGIGAGVAPADAVEIARIASPPLAEIVDFINRYSVNYPSELTLKSLGAAFGGAGTTAAGVRVVRDTLAQLDVPLAGFRMTDGSGLSVADRMMPITIARILEAILNGRGESWRVLRASIPVAGGPGSLYTRMTSRPTVGNLRGKTGQIANVRAMAGWVSAADGVPVVYVAMFNRAPSPLALTAPLDLLGGAIARLPFA